MDEGRMQKEAGQGHTIEYIEGASFRLWHRRQETGMFLPESNMWVAAFRAMYTLRETPTRSFKPDRVGPRISLSSVLIPFCGAYVVAHLLDLSLTIQEHGIWIRKRRN